MRPGQRTLVVLSASSLLCQWSTRTTRHLKRAIARNWPHGGQKLSKNCPKVGRECGAYSTQPRSRGYPGTLLYLAVAFLQMGKRASRYPCWSQPTPTSEVSKLIGSLPPSRSRPSLHGSCAILQTPALRQFSRPFAPTPFTSRAERPPWGRFNYNPR